MSAEEAFLNTLSRKRRNDLHLRFFENNGQLQSIFTPLFTQFSGKKRIQPYRNNHCLKPDCIYDEEELVSRFKQSGLSSFATFICHTCRKQIQLSKFSYDSSLSEIIEDVWKRYNKESKIVCEKVQIFRNGIWEPILPNYMKNLEENLRRELQGEANDEERKIIGFYQTGNDSNRSYNNGIMQPGGENIRGKRKVIIYKNLFKLSDFDSKEYQEIMIAFQKEGDPMKNLKEEIFHRYGQTITNADLISVQNETWFPKHQMAFFIKYLDDWSQRMVAYEFNESHQIANKRNPQLNKAKFFVFCVVHIISYDKFYDVAKYEIWSDNLTFVKQKLSRDQLVSQLDKIFIIMFYDQRWILTISDPRTKCIKVVDFLDAQLSRIRVEEIDEIARFIIQKELFPVKVSNQEGSPEIKTINFYSDCGFWVATYLFKAIIQDRILGEMPSFSIKFSEKAKLKESLSWLFLKIFFSNDSEEKIQGTGLEPELDSISTTFISQESESNKGGDSEQDLYEEWNFDRSNKPSVVGDDNKQSYHKFQQQSMRNSLDEGNSPRRASGRSSFNSVASLRSGQKQQIKNNPKQSNLFDQDYPQNDSLNQSRSLNELLSRSIISSASSQKSSILPPIARNNSFAGRKSFKGISQQKLKNPPYFQVEKQELEEILSGWHQKLLSEAKEAKRSKDELEFQQQAEKEKMYIDKLEINDARKALGINPIELSRDIQNPQNEEDDFENELKQAKYHSTQIDKLLDNKLDPFMLDQLSVEDLTEILIKFNKIRFAENPLARLEAKRLIDPLSREQYLHGQQSPQIDPFYKYIGMDFEGIDPENQQELQEWNKALSSSVSEIIKSRNLQIQLEQSKQKEKQKSKRSKSKSKRSKSKQNKKK